MFYAINQMKMLIKVLLFHLPGQIGQKLEGNLREKYTIVESMCS